MNPIKLTIAIPSLPDRMRKNLEPLYAKILAQIGKAKDIEVISILDNRTMSIGRKRTKLFSIASGRYTCIIDDDDNVVDDFVSTMRKTIDDSTNVDVICYSQSANVNGKTWKIDTSLKHNLVHPFDQLAVDNQGKPIVCKRPPWHWCAWRTDLAKSIPFGDSNCHEDAIFVREAVKVAKTEIVLDKVMCLYNESQTAYNTQLDINQIRPVQI